MQKGSGRSSQGAASGRTAGSSACGFHLHRSGRRRSRWARLQRRRDTGVQSDIAWDVGRAPSWRLLSLSSAPSGSISTCAAIWMSNVGGRRRGVHLVLRSFRFASSSRGLGRSRGVCRIAFLLRIQDRCWPSASQMILGRSSPGGFLWQTRPVYSQSVPGFNSKQVWPACFT